jgi:hypothetical protein
MGELGLCLVLGRGLSFVLYRIKLGNYFGLHR